MKKILGGFRVYFAKIIFRALEENFEKVLCNCKYFRVILINFWLNLKNNEEIFGEIGRFFLEIVKRLGKFVRCTGMSRKIWKILRGTLRQILKKRKVNFEEIFCIKKCIKSKLIRNSPFAPNRAPLSHLPITSYLSLVYIKATTQAIREETIFVDTTVVSYPFTHRNGSHQQLCAISLSYISYIFLHWNLYLLKKGFFCRRFHRSEGRLQKHFLQIKVKEDLKFLLVQIMLKYSKKRRWTVAAPWVLHDEPVLTIHPWLGGSKDWHVRSIIM